MNIYIYIHIYTVYCVHVSRLLPMVRAMFNLKYIHINENDVKL